MSILGKQGLGDPRMNEWQAFSVFDQVRYASDMVTKKKSKRWVPPVTRTQHPSQAESIKHPKGGS